MNHKVFCNNCMSKVTITVAGDLGQYSDSLINCPCGESYVVPKLNLNKEYELYHLGDLEAPKGIIQAFIKALKTDTTYYDLWDANLTMVIHDSGVSIETAQKAAKNILNHILMD